jgi:hypothetical protein
MVSGWSASPLLMHCSSRSSAKTGVTARNQEVWDQSFKTAGVKAQNPIPNDLQRDRADPCRIGTRATVINGGKR